MARLIVVIDPRLNDGQLTLIPAEGTDEGFVSREAEERAIEQAVRMRATGRRFRPFSSVEDAVQASRQKTAAEPPPLSPTQDASTVLADPGAPRQARQRPAFADEPRRLVPLGEFLRQQLGPIGAAPRDLRRHMWGTERQQPRYQEGVSRLLEGLRAPLFPLPGAHRVEVDRLSDASPVQRQLESWFQDMPRSAPRPGELVTPGENRTLGEIFRILDHQRDLEGRRSIVPVIPL